MKSIYFEKDDILEIRVSDKPIVREVSQGWHTNISYAADGTIVEIVLLDAKRGADAHGVQEGCLSGLALGCMHKFTLDALTTVVVQLGYVAKFL